MELGAMESSKLNFFNKKMHAAKSGSPGDILAAWLMGYSEILLHLRVFYLQACVGF